MNRIALIHEVIKQIRSIKNASEQDRATHRVAVRYLEASEAQQYDQMLRLQVLEGAAGVPLDRWWKKGKFGFKPATDALSGTNIKPEWLSLKESGMFKILKSIAQKLISSYKLRAIEPFDILNNALTGMPMDASKVDTGESLIQRPPYTAGKFLMGKILNGQETPETVAKGILGEYIKRRVKNEARKQMEPLLEDDQGKTMDIPDIQSSPYDGIGEFMAALLFGRGPSNPLSKKLTDLMRHTWKTSGRKYGEVMTIWLDKIQSGETFKLQDFAQEVDTLPQVITKYFWPDAWNAFFKALRSNKNLLNEISNAAQQVGVEWDPSDPVPLYWDDPMAAARGKPRPKVKTASSRVADRWFQKH